MGEGLAAHVTNMYGNGEGNTIKHYYDKKGTKPKSKTKKKEGSNDRISK